ncbi:MAG: hypothetical protein GX573_21750 [Chloroflexi bacterium]|nr:hypothetical protein [Chloroflexota bacterium]
MRLTDGSIVLSNANGVGGIAHLSPYVVEGSTELRMAATASGVPPYLRLRIADGTETNHAVTKGYIDDRIRYTTNAIVEGQGVTNDTAIWTMTVRTPYRNHRLLTRLYYYDLSKEFDSTFNPDNGYIVGVDTASIYQQYLANAPHSMDESASGEHILTTDAAGCLSIPVRHYGGNYYENGTYTVSGKLACVIGEVVVFEDASWSLQVTVTGM